MIVVLLRKGKDMGFKAKGCAFEICTLTINLYSDTSVLKHNLFQIIVQKPNHF